MSSDTVIQSTKTTIKSFQDLIVWQKALQLFLDVNEDIKRFPIASAAKVIENQIIRSAASISSNIAEGYGKYKGKEFSRYLIISRGSLTETQDWYIKAFKLGYVDEIKFKTRIREAEEMIKIINSIITKIKYKQGGVD